MTNRSLKASCPAAAFTLMFCSTCTGICSSTGPRPSALPCSAFEGEGVAWQRSGQCPVDITDPRLRIQDYGSKWITDPRFVGGPTSAALTVKVCCVQKLLVVHRLTIPTRLSHPAASVANSKQLSPTNTTGSPAGRPAAPAGCGWCGTDLGASSHHPNYNDDSSLLITMIAVITHQR